MSRTMSAYAAGLIDGEGCILINHSGGTYRAAVTVGMTSKALVVLERMKRCYGGSIKCSREATDRWDSAWAWTVAGVNARALLHDVAPYLVLKAEQAQIALKVEEIRAGLGPLAGRRRPQWTDAERDRCAVLKHRMHELNAKGPTTPSLGNGTPIARRVAGTWVTDQADLFSDLGWAPFSGPWPVSGMTRSGVAYPLPPWDVHTSAGGSSSLLPTPRTSDTNGAGSHGDGGLDLRSAAASLLPTPQARDGDGRGASDPERRRALNARRGSGQLDEVASHLLPTPTAMDANGARNETANRVTTGHHSGTTLSDFAWKVSTGVSTEPPSDSTSG